MNDQDPWRIREERFGWQPVRTASRGVASVWVVAVVAVILIGVTLIALWAFGVFASDVRGIGEAEKAKNAAANRIKAQEGFEQLHADIQAADRVIVISAAALTETPDDATLRTQLMGQKQYCTGLVGDYNAKARKFTQEEFRAADLPPAIDLTDPTTDCKE